MVSLPLSIRQPINQKPLIHIPLIPPQPHLLLPFKQGMVLEKVHIVLRWVIQNQLYVPVMLFDRLEDIVHHPAENLDGEWVEKVEAVIALTDLVFFS